jgi:hypothetical protein
MFPNRGVTFLVYAFFFLPAMFWNVLFHAGAAVLFRAYCPGLVTAVCIYPPVVYVVTRRAFGDGLLNAESGSVALVIAGAFHLWEVGHNVFKAW